MGRIDRLWAMNVSWSVDLHRPSLPRGQTCSPCVLPAHADKTGYTRQASSASVHQVAPTAGRPSAIRPPIIGHCFLVGVAFRVEGRCFRCCQVTVANAVTKAPILSAREHLRSDGIPLISFCTVHSCRLRLCNLCRMTATHHGKPNMRAAFGQHHVAPPPHLLDFLRHRRDRCGRRTAEIWHPFQDVENDSSEK